MWDTLHLFLFPQKESVSNCALPLSVLHSYRHGRRWGPHCFPPPCYTYPALSSDSADNSSLKRQGSGVIQRSRVWAGRGVERALSTWCEVAARLVLLLTRLSPASEDTDKTLLSTPQIRLEQISFLGRRWGKKSRWQCIPLAVAIREKRTIEHIIFLIDHVRRWGIILVMVACGTLSQ